MCGIAGFVGSGDRGTLTKMTNSLAHRGPDDSGIYHHSALGVYLGHRRLSIVDIGGGHQPMGNRDGSIQVIFNGEIYNHIELRAELVAKGYVFRSSHSDTEVLVHGYEEWGNGLPFRLNGMFAFAIFDQRNKTLFLARDRFGEKPLFFFCRPGLFAFASELKSLLQHPDISANVSKIGMAKLFALGFIPAPSAIIESVFKLEPGHHLSLNILNFGVKDSAYWEFKISSSGGVESPRGELEEQLRRLIKQAVGRRLMSDVPLGIFLSGGIDSSIILSAVAEQCSPSDIHTFTIGFDERSFDESEYARLVARHFGAKHYEERLDLDTARNLLAPVLDGLDEPLGDPSILPTYLLARFARQYVKVALGGDGGDELFAGYDPFRALRPAELYSKVIPERLHRAVRRVVEAVRPSDRNMGLEFRLKRTLRGLSYPVHLWNPVWLGPLDPEGLSHLFGETINVKETYHEVIEAWNQPGSDTLVNRTLGFYTRLYLPHDILTKVDRASMMVSLEARAPFLDNDLVEFAANLPSNYKLHGQTTKFLLKSAFKNQLPEAIIRRPKKGFGIPISAWLRDWGDPSFIDSLPYIDHQWLKARWREHQEGVADHRQLLWCAISMDRFIKSIPK
jgi:asparagine synthase (glutamine-hydrolysing)